MSKRGRGKRAVAAYPRCSDCQRPQQQPGGRRNRTSSIASSSGTTTPRASRPSTSVSRRGIPFPVLSGRTDQDSSRSVCAIGPAECDWCVRLSVCLTVPFARRDVPGWVPMVCLALCPMCPAWWPGRVSLVCPSVCLSHGPNRFCDAAVTDRAVVHGR